MNDIEKMLTMIEDTDNHCRIMYNEVCDILKSKGMTDEEIQYVIDCINKFR